MLKTASPGKRKTNQGGNSPRKFLREKKELSIKEFTFEEGWLGFVDINNLIKDKGYLSLKFNFSKLTIKENAFISLNIRLKNLTLHGDCIYLEPSCFVCLNDCVFELKASEIHFEGCPFFLNHQSSNFHSLARVIKLSGKIFCKDNSNLLTNTTNLIELDLSEAKGAKAEWFNITQCKTLRVIRYPKDWDQSVKDAFDKTLEENRPNVQEKPINLSAGSSDQTGVKAQVPVEENNFKVSKIDTKNRWVQMIIYMFLVSLLVFFAGNLMYSLMNFKMALLLTSVLAGIMIVSLVNYEVKYRLNCPQTGLGSRYLAGGEMKNSHHVVAKGGIEPPTQGFSVDLPG
ncbi:MAG: hypothetical protein FJ186_00805 [Gammaproteobacteria bacterium]|nr:hypothetical protein [Gammaproteobacteria bacterium]